MTKANTKLMKEITDLLARHEVENNMLALDLAIFVSLKERDQIERDRKTLKEI